MKNTEFKPEKPISKSLAIYIHYPFCKAKCPYCDFNSHVDQNINSGGSEAANLANQMICAYENQLDFFGELLLGGEITSIFFGGGTPSLMPILMVEKILQKIAAIWPISKTCEISLEANPTSVESQKFDELKNCGINRLSLGIQALNDSDLKFLGRKHSATEAINAIELAAKYFENFSFDLIYARPNQSLQNWQAELQLALSMKPKHLSLYQLTIEKGTKFFSQFQKGEFLLPGQEQAALLHEKTNEIMENHGFEAYEISNYAKANFRCLHNLAYWRGQEYLGIGAGAHSRLFLDDQVSEKLDSFAIPLIKNIEERVVLKEENQIVLEINSKIPDEQRKFENATEIAAKGRDRKRFLKKFAVMMFHEPSKWLAEATNSSKNSCGIQNFTQLSRLEIAEELLMMGLRIAEGVLEKTCLIQLGLGFDEMFEEKKLQFLLDQGLLEMIGVEGNRCLVVAKNKILLTNAIILKLCEALKQKNFKNHQN